MLHRLDDLQEVNESLKRKRQTSLEGEPRRGVGYISFKYLLNFKLNECFLQIFGSCRESEAIRNRIRKKISLENFIPTGQNPEEWPQIEGGQRLPMEDEILKVKEKFRA